MKESFELHITFKIKLPRFSSQEEREREEKNRLLFYADLKKIKNQRYTF